ncbi:MAG: EAL domain-containing protein [Rhodoferax sp.]|nr:EAL domain-containing protein [Rhodoferax sp.]
MPWPVSVNIGARQLQQKEFVDRLRGLLAAHPAVSPNRLELEVLETSAMENLDQVPAWVAGWRAEPLWLDLPVMGQSDLPLLFASAEHRAWIAVIKCC